MAPGPCWVRRPHADRSNHGLADSDSPHWVFTLPCLQDFIGHSGSQAVADAAPPRARDVTCSRAKELSRIGSSVFSKTLCGAKRSIQSVNSNLVAQSRSLIERARVATRFDTLTRSFLAAVVLASTGLELRVVGGCLARINNQLTSPNDPDGGITSLKLRVGCLRSTVD